MSKKIIKKLIASLLLFSYIFISSGLVIPARATGDNYDSYPLAYNTLLAGKVIILDAGHGAGCVNGAGGYLEDEYNLIFANKLKVNLERCGATVYMTRPTSQDVYSYTRMSMVNILALNVAQEVYQKRLETAAAEEIPDIEYNLSEIERLKGIMQSVIANNALAEEYYNTPYSTDTVINSDLKKIFEYENIPEVYEKFLFLSIHSNAFSDPQANGTVTYYLSNTWSDSLNYYTGYANTAKNKTFAQLLVNEVSTAASFKNRGTAVNDYFMLREHNLPGALIETAFHTNDTDRAKLMSEAYQNRIVNAMTFAMMKYFGVAVPNNVVVTLPSSSAYSLGDSIITGAAQRTTVNTFISNISYGLGKRVVSSAGAERSGDSWLCTGDKLQIFDSAGNVTKEYKIIICGDINSSGDIALLDLLMLQKYLLNKISLDSAALMAADVNKDGSVSLLDLLIVQKHLLGTAQI